MYKWSLPAVPVCSCVYSHTNTRTHAQIHIFLEQLWLRRKSRWSRFDPHCYSSLPVEVQCTELQVSPNLVCGWMLHKVFKYRKKHLYECVCEWDLSLLLSGIEVSVCLMFTCGKLVSCRLLQFPSYTVGIAACHSHHSPVTHYLHWDNGVQWAPVHCILRDTLGG